MVFYEFYMRDQAEGDKLIGILPERRNDPDRIDLKSIMKWPQVALGDKLDIDNVYVVTMAMCDGADGDFTYEEILSVNHDLMDEE